MIKKADKDNYIAIINQNKCQEKLWNLLIIIFLLILNETALIKQIRSNVNNSNPNPLTISGLIKFIKLICPIGL
jgi:hypothetical protein